MAQDWTSKLTGLREVEQARRVRALIDTWQALLKRLGAVGLDGDPVGGIVVVRALQDDLEDMVLPDLVALAREQDASWSQIGEALGVTRQAARKRFGGSGDGAA